MKEENWYKICVEGLLAIGFIKEIDNSKKIK